MKYIIEIDLPDNETIKRVISKCPVHWQIWGYCGDTIAKPSIDIVRCGECKHYDTPECQIKVSLYGLNADDFCSYGERKE